MIRLLNILLVSLVIMMQCVPLNAAVSKKKSSSKKYKTEISSKKNSKSKSSKKKNSKKKKSSTASRKKTITTKSSVSKRQPVVAAPEPIYTDYVGIDVSHHNGDIDWNAVMTDKKIKFVYIKATEGATYTDPTYIANFKGAKNAGFLVGSYHFLRSSSSIAEQFENYKASVDPIDQDLLPVIDIEVIGTWNRQQLQDSLKIFAKMVKKYFGKAPIIYTSHNFYNDYLAPEFNHYNLFIGRYAEDEPVLSNGDTKYTIWQFTGKGRVKGIKQSVDLNKLHSHRKLKDICMPHGYHKGVKYEKK